MMSTTHAAFGVACASVLAFVAPELAASAALAAYAGGVFPDLDTFGLDHRKTLHYPVGYWLLAVPALVVAALAPGPWTVGAAAFLASAGLHSVTDIFGGGLGLRPWLEDDDRGVYDHRRDRWIPPKRWVRYDGAPEDLLLVVALSVPPLLVFDGAVRTLVVAGLVVSAVYALLRKRLPDYAPELLR